MRKVLWKILSKNHIIVENKQITPKEKAIELCHKFSTDGLIMDAEIRCALILVDEILTHMLFWKSDDKIGLLNSINTRKFWQQVKHEINQL